MDMTDVLDRLNKCLGHPQGVDATEVTALRDDVAASIDAEEPDDAGEEEEEEVTSEG